MRPKVKNLQINLQSLFSTKSLAPHQQFIKPISSHRSLPISSEKIDKPEVSIVYSGYKKILMA